MTPKQISYRNTANGMIEKMAVRGMDGYYCDTREEACAKALELMQEGASVSFGGSMTLNEIGLLDAIRQGNYEVIDRADAKTPEERRAIYGRIVTADYFLMSTNAITLNGELINIDGFGNRVACLCCGPENVIVVAGMNKVTSTVEEGINRAKNIAAPPNAVRLSRPTPCTQIGRCAECQMEGCICAQTVITRRSLTPHRIKVILVGEELGF